MLQGQKHLAVFHDAVLPNKDVPEEIIPERAFAPFVVNGQILRFQKDFPSHTTEAHLLRYVCFTLPEHEWRAHFYLWLKEKIISESCPFNLPEEVLCGLVLGYSHQDIEHFLQHKKNSTF